MSPALWGLVGLLFGFGLGVAAMLLAGGGRCRPCERAAGILPGDFTAPPRPKRHAYRAGYGGNPLKCRHQVSEEGAAWFEACQEGPAHPVHEVRSNRP